LLDRYTPEVRQLETPLKTDKRESSSPHKDSTFAEHRPAAVNPIHLEGGTRQVLELLHVDTLGLVMDCSATITGDFTVSGILYAKSIYAGSNQGLKLCDMSGVIGLTIQNTGTVLVTGNTHVAGTLTLDTTATLHVDSTSEFDGTVQIDGTLTVNSATTGIHGTTTTIDSTNLHIDSITEFDGLVQLDAEVHCNANVHMTSTATVDGNLTFNAGLFGDIINWVTKSADFTITGTTQNEFYSLPGGYILTLPDPTLSTGKIVGVRQSNDTQFWVKLAQTGAGNFVSKEGTATTAYIKRVNDSVMWQSDGTSWIAIQDSRCLYTDSGWIGTNDESNRHLGSVTIVLGSTVVPAIGTKVLGATSGCYGWVAESHTTNIAQNGDCEEATLGPSIDNGHSGEVNCTWLRSNTKAHSVTCSWALKKTSNTGAGSGYVLWHDANFSTTDMHGLTTNTTYALSVWCYNAGSLAMTLRVREYYGAAWHEILTLSSSKTNEWELLTGTFTISNTSAALIVIAEMDTGEAVNTYAYFDDFTLLTTSIILRDAVTVAAGFTAGEVLNIYDVAGTTTHTHASVSTHDQDTDFYHGLNKSVTELLVKCFWSTVPSEATAVEINMLGYSDGTTHTGTNIMGVDLNSICVQGGATALQVFDHAGARVHMTTTAGFYKVRAVMT